MLEYLAETIQGKRGEGAQKRLWGDICRGFLRRKG